MSSGGVQSTFLLTGAGDVLGDVGGFLSGPAGDPVRIRQIAGMVDTLAAEYRGATLALDDAVIALTQSWTGTAATAFRGAWTARTRSSPSTVLGVLAANLAAFSRELRDYADKLEHAQNEHWIQLGLMAALSVLNAAQGGADPVTDAAEVAAGAGLEVATGISLAGLGELALGGAVSGFGSDALSQFGADLLDRCDPAFDQTGDDVVPVFDVGEAASSALNGALSEVDDGLWHGGGGEFDPGSGLGDQAVDANPLSPTRAEVDESARPFSSQELRISQLLQGEGHAVASVAESALPGHRVYDALVDGLPTEFKTLEGPRDGPASNATVLHALQRANGQFADAGGDQSAVVFLDGRGSGLTSQEAQRGLQRWLGTGWNRMSSVRIVGDGWQVIWP